MPTPDFFAGLIRQGLTGGPRFQPRKTISPVASFLTGGAQPLTPRQGYEPSWTRESGFINTMLDWFEFMEGQKRQRAQSELERERGEQGLRLEAGGQRLDIARRMGPGFVNLMKLMGM